MELRGKKAAFLGDSITHGFGVTSPDKLYMNRLMEMGQLSEIQNCGLCGTRIARQRKTSEFAHWDEDFCKRVEDIDENADIIVVFGGTNDHGHGDAPLGTPNDRTPDTFWGACHYLMNRLIERFAGKTIVIMTPLHCASEDNHKIIEENGDSVVTLSIYVDIIKSVAAWYALPLLDLHTQSGIQPRVPLIAKKYCPDGLHPNDDGHLLIANKLYQFLLSL